MESSAERVSSSLADSVLSTKVINLGSKLNTVKLDEENFLLWKLQVTTALRGHGLLKFIEKEAKIPRKFVRDKTSTESAGASQEEEDDLQVNPAYEHWIRQDSLITAWLLGSMSNSLLAEMLDCDSASEVWSTLNARFSSRNLARVMELKSKLESLKKGGLKLEEYFSKIKNLVDSLAAAGRKIPHEDHVMHILAGLGVEYDSTVSVISEKEESPSLQKVYSLLLSQENRIARNTQVNIDGSLPSINLTTHKQSDDSQKGGKQGHGKGKKYWQNKTQCQLCGKTGHTALKCYFRFERGFLGPNPNAYQQNSSLMNQSSQNTRPMNAFLLQHDLNQDNQWYPDSGASHHVTHDLSNLATSSEYQGDNQVHVGNDSGSQKWPSSSSRQGS